MRGVMRDDREHARRRVMSEVGDYIEILVTNVHCPARLGWRVGRGGEVSERCPKGWESDKRVIYGSLEPPLRAARMTSSAARWKGSAGSARSFHRTRARRERS